MNIRPASMFEGQTYGIMRGRAWRSSPAKCVCPENRHYAPTCFHHVMKFCKKCRKYVCVRCGNVSFVLLVKVA
jgi:hypothetical protein